LLHSTGYGSAAERAGQRRTILLGVAGAVLVATGLFVDRWLPAFLLIGLLTLGTAVALDAPVGSLPGGDDDDGSPTILRSLWVEAPPEPD
jgi:hypothetical protein